MIFRRDRRNRATPARRPELTGDEEHVIELLLAGDTPFLTALRTQFELLKERGPSRYRLPDEYGIRRLFVGSDLNRHLATSAPTPVYVDDLVILDNRLGLMTVQAEVGHGLLTSVMVRPLTPVDEWPLDGPRADSYGYRADGEDPAAALGRTERDLSRWASLPPPAPGADPADAPPWLRKLMTGPPPADPVTSPGASAADVREAETELGFKLPTQYKQLVRWSNGVNLWGVQIAGLHDAYMVDDRLVFEAGSFGDPVSALDSGGAVWWGNAETGEFEPFEDCLADWVAGIKDSAARASG